MILVGTALVVGLAAGRLLPRLPRHASRPDIRWWPLLLVGVAGQVAAALVEGVFGARFAVAGGAALLVFAARNAHLVGIGVLSVGLAANVTVVALNGAMPVRASSLVKADVVERGETTAVDLRGMRRLERPDDRLAALGDVVPIEPFGLVVSFGDLVIALGCADVVAHLSRRRQRSRRAAARASAGADQLIDLRYWIRPDEEIEAALAITSASPLHDWGRAPSPVPSSGSQYSASPDVDAPATVEPAMSAPASHSR
jgi:hypothetical protein